MTAARVRLTLLRHGPTDWTADRRLQGRTDRPLSAAGRTAVAAWRRPPLAAATVVLTSPLARARETAALLGLDARIDDRLIEADWGAWEGRRLADLADDPAARLVERERDGLDFRPPGGESPREVQARLAPLLADIAAAGRPVLAVTHKGVIRAVYALATGWRMRCRPPHRLAEAACHHFHLDPAGRPAIAALNDPLQPAEPEA